MAKKHPHKEIAKSIEYAVSKGWAVKPAGKSAHAWGRLLCPYNDAECRCGVFCQISIWSTPKNPEKFAEKLQHYVDHCIHEQTEKSGEA